jgi:hypothetical protein
VKMHYIMVEWYHKVDNSEGKFCEGALHDVGMVT